MKRDKSRTSCRSVVIDLTKADGLEDATVKMDRVKALTKNMSKLQSGFEQEAFLIEFREYVQLTCCTQHPHREKAVVALQKWWDDHVEKHSMQAAVTQIPEPISPDAVLDEYMPENAEHDVFAQEGVAQEPMPPQSDTESNMDNVNGQDDSDEPNEHGEAEELDEDDEHHEHDEHDEHQIHGEHQNQVSANIEEHASILGTQNGVAQAVDDGAAGSSTVQAVEVPYEGNAIAESTLNGVAETDDDGPAVPSTSHAAETEQSAHHQVMDSTIGHQQIQQTQPALPDMASAAGLPNDGNAAPVSVPVINIKYPTPEGLLLPADCPQLEAQPRGQPSDASSIRSEASADVSHNESTFSVAQDANDTMASEPDPSEDEVAGPSEEGAAAESNKPVGQENTPSSDLVSGTGLLSLDHPQGVHPDHVSVPNTSNAEAENEVTTLATDRPTSDQTVAVTSAATADELLQADIVEQAMTEASGGDEALADATQPTNAVQAETDTVQETSDIPTETSVIDQADSPSPPVTVIPPANNESTVPDASAHVASPDLAPQPQRYTTTTVQVTGFVRSQHRVSAQQPDTNAVDSYDAGLRDGYVIRGPPATDNGSAIEQSQDSQAAQSHAAEQSSSGNVSTTEASHGAPVDAAINAAAKSVSELNGDSPYTFTPEPKHTYNTRSTIARKPVASSSSAVSNTAKFIGNASTASAVPDDAGVGSSQHPPTPPSLRKRVQDTLKEGLKEKLKEGSKLFTTSPKKSKNKGSQ